MTEPAHILVVDDDDSIRRLLQMLFHNAGYRVSTAATGEEALAYVDLVTPDLIIIDLMMPGINGQEVTQQIKSDRTRPFIPIIMLTAQHDQRAKISGLDAGADDFLTKPIDLEELLARVRVMLRLQRSQRSLRDEQRKTELLLSLSRELNSSIELDRLLPHFMRQLTNAIGAVRASIILTTERDARFYSSSGRTPNIPLDELLRSGVAGWVLRERQALIIKETREDSRWQETGAISRLIRSAASVPILREQRLLGVITLVHHTPNHFTDDHLALLESVAAQTGVAIEHAELFSQVADERSTLNVVLNGASDPILLIGADNRLLLANQAAHERLDLEGKTGAPLEHMPTDSELHGALNHHIAEPSNGAVPPEIAIGSEIFSLHVSPVRSADRSLLGRVAVLQNITAIKELERREQERLRSVFQRYVAPEVVERVLTGEADFSTPVERDVVVIFADIRGYTAMSEGLPPSILVEQVLNRYFSAMTEVLHHYEGTVDKFMGDGLIGLFGTPITHADDPQRAIDAAVAMQLVFDQLRQFWQAQLGQDVGLGIGIGFGRAVVGSIGSPKRLDYTVIGDVVNTASRLSGLAHAGDILISHRLVEQLAPQSQTAWKLRPRDKVQLKGKLEPHQIYDVEYR